MRLIIDLNVIEDKNVVDALPSHCQIIVPEIAWIELWKPADAAHRELGMRKATELLIDRVENVFFSAGVNDLLRTELATGIPASDVVDEDATCRFRDLIRDLHGRGTGWALQAYRENVGWVKPEIDRTIYDGSTQKRLMIDGFDAWKALLTAEMLRELRRSNDEQYHRWVISEVARRMVAGLHGGEQALDIKPTDAYYLAKKRSVTLAYVTTTCADSFLWVLKNGIHSQPEHRVSNHRNDWDYITTAVAGSCPFITKDKRAKVIYEHVQAVVNGIVTPGNMSG